MLLGIMNSMGAVDFLHVILVSAIMPIENGRSVKSSIEVDLTNECRLTFFWTENVLS